MMRKLLTGFHCFARIPQKSYKYGEIIILGEIMRKLLVCYCVFLLSFIVPLFALTKVRAQINVGVKEGDWIKYRNNISPEETLFQIQQVDGDTITQTLSNGDEYSIIHELDTGAITEKSYEIKDVFFVIPSNLDVGDNCYIWLDETFSNIEITNEIYLSNPGYYGRTVGSQFSSTWGGLDCIFSGYWDKRTGILVEYIIKTDSFIYHCQASETSDWQSHDIVDNPEINLKSGDWATYNLTIFDRARQKIISDDVLRFDYGSISGTRVSFVYSSSREYVNGTCDLADGSFVSLEPNSDWEYGTGLSLIPSNLNVGKVFYSGIFNYTKIGIIEEKTLTVKGFTRNCVYSDFLYFGASFTDSYLETECEYYWDEESGILLRSTEKSDGFSGGTNIEQTLSLSLIDTNVITSHSATEPTEPEQTQEPEQQTEQEDSSPEPKPDGLPDEEEPQLPIEVLLVAITVVAIVAVAFLSYNLGKRKRIHEQNKEILK
ncbi:MAG: hypothetical protein JSW14_06945 [Candidatus Bathyarchaeum sp.]|nr:MAG: hypothetical protein JSW14_06945 [Candidatus Bathyarchaeum sp.]